MGRRFNDFHKIADELPMRARVFVDAYAAWWLQGMQQFVPVDKGDLRNSLGSERRGEFESVVYATAAHAIHQEFGTIHQPGTPFMRQSRRALYDAFKRDGRSVFGDGFARGPGGGA